MTGGYSEELENKFVYRMEPILECHCETNNDQNSGPWKVILPNTIPGVDIALNNISFNASLANENELNNFDEYYDATKDEGDIISSVALDYNH